MWAPKVDLNELLSVFGFSHSLERYPTPRVMIIFSAVREHYSPNRPVLGGAFCRLRGRKGIQW
jgi:hypothetical protein